MDVCDGGDDTIERTKLSAAQKLLRGQNRWVGLKT
jgi:hypothetical protein